MSRILHKNVAILRVGDKGALDELRAVTNLDEHVLGWLSETEAVRLIEVNLAKGPKRGAKADNEEAEPVEAEQEEAA